MRKQLKGLALAALLAWLALPAAAAPWWGGGGEGLWGWLVKVWSGAVERAELGTGLPGFLAKTGPESLPDGAPFAPPAAPNCPPGGCNKDGPHSDPDGKP